MSSKGFKLATIFDSDRDVKVARLVQITGVQDLSDVTITNLQDREILQWNNTTNVWENQAAPGADLSLFSTIVYLNDAIYNFIDPQQMLFDPDTLDENGASIGGDHIVTSHTHDNYIYLKPITTWRFKRYPKKLPISDVYTSGSYFCKDLSFPRHDKTATDLNYQIVLSNPYDYWLEPLDERHWQRRYIPVPHTVGNLAEVNLDDPPSWQSVNYVGSYRANRAMTTDGPGVQHYDRNDLKFIGGEQFANSHPNVLQENDIVYCIHYANNNNSYATDWGRFNLQCTGWFTMGIPQDIHGNYAWNPTSAMGEVSDYLYANSMVSYRYYGNGPFYIRDENGSTIFTKGHSYHNYNTPHFGHDNMYFGRRDYAIQYNLCDFHVFRPTNTAGADADGVLLDDLYLENDKVPTGQEESFYLITDRSTTEHQEGDSWRPNGELNYNNSIRTESKNHHVTDTDGYSSHQYQGYGVSTGQAGSGKFNGSDQWENPSNMTTDPGGSTIGTTTYPAYDPATWFYRVDTTAYGNAITGHTFAATTGYDPVTTINNVEPTSTTGSGKKFKANFVTNLIGGINSVEIVDGGYNYAVNDTLTFAYADLTSGSGTSTTDLIVTVTETNGASPGVGLQLNMRTNWQGNIDHYDRNLPEPGSLEAGWNYRVGDRIVVSYDQMTNANNIHNYTDTRFPGNATEDFIMRVSSLANDGGYQIPWTGGESVVHYPANETNPGGVVASDVPLWTNRYANNSVFHCATGFDKKVNGVGGGSFTGADGEYYNENAAISHRDNTMRIYGGGPTHCRNDGFANSYIYTANWGDFFHHGIGVGSKIKLDPTDYAGANTFGSVEEVTVTYMHSATSADIDPPFSRNIQGWSHQHHSGNRYDWQYCHEHENGGWVHTTPRNFSDLGIVAGSVIEYNNEHRYVQEVRLGGLELVMNKAFGTNPDSPVILQSTIDYRYGIPSNPGQNADRIILEDRKYEKDGFVIDSKEFKFIDTTYLQTANTETYVMKYDNNDEFDTVAELGELFSVAADQTSYSQDVIVLEEIGTDYFPSGSSNYADLLGNTAVSGASHDMQGKVVMETGSVHNLSGFVPSGRLTNRSGKLWWSGGSVNFDSSGQVFSPHDPINDIRTIGVKVGDYIHTNSYGTRKIRSFDTKVIGDQTTVNFYMENNFTGDFTDYDAYNTSSGVEQWAVQELFMLETPLQADLEPHFLNHISRRTTKTFTGDGVTNIFAIDHIVGNIDVWVNGVYQIPEVTNSEYEFFRFADGDPYSTGQRDSINQRIMDTGGIQSDAIRWNLIEDFSFQNINVSQGVLAPGDYDYHSSSGTEVGLIPGVQLSGYPMVSFSFSAYAGSESLPNTLLNGTDYFTLVGSPADWNTFHPFTRFSTITNPIYRIVSGGGAGPGNSAAYYYFLTDSSNTDKRRPVWVKGTQISWDINEDYTYDQIWSSIPNYDHLRETFIETGQPFWDGSGARKEINIFSQHNGSNGQYHIPLTVNERNPATHVQFSYIPPLGAIIKIRVY